MSQPPTDQDSAKSHPGEAWTVFAHLLTGPLVYGGAGWWLDSVLDTSFLLPVGALLGVGLSLYLIWLKYGRVS